MTLLAKLISFLEHVFFKVVKDDGTGHLYSKHTLFRHGLLLWNNKNKFLVMSYPIQIAMTLILTLGIVLQHTLNIRKTNWFGMVYSLLCILFQLSFSIPFYMRESTLTELSRALDKWWKYKYLEEEKRDIKEKTEKKIDKFLFYYFGFMKWSALIYATLNIMYSVFVSDTSLKKLLIFQCWSPFSLDVWWGFSIVFSLELTVMTTNVIMGGRMLSFMYSAMVTIGGQFRLVGVALLTVEQRVDKLMKPLAIGSDTEVKKIHNKLVQQEIKEAVMHIHHLLNSAEITSKIFETSINVHYYPGVFCISFSTLKLMTEWKSEFKVFFRIIITSITLLSLFMFCFCNQILKDQYERFRFIIYDSPWYNLQTDARKDLLILQSMLIKPPSIRTLFGTSANMEFLASVFNAYYCFINAGRTLNINVA